jgi:DNA-binding NarL/FixJ family response regulator
MPDSLTRVDTRPNDVVRVPLGVEPLDLSDASSVLTETCSALALSLQEGDLDAAERLFAFVVDLTADRRAAVTDVLTPMLLGTVGRPLLTPSEAATPTTHEFLQRLRRPVSTVGSKGVLLHCADDGPMRLMLELTALLLDDAHVPVHLRLGLAMDAVVRTASSSSVAAVAFGATSQEQLAHADLAIRQLRRGGVGVVVAANPELVAPEAARSVGASAAAWQPGEIADVALRLRGPLSRGEAEVLRLASDGYTNVRIAHELDVSLSAVKARLEASYAKLNAADRTHAVAIAMRQHWIA